MKTLSAEELQELARSGALRDEDGKKVRRRHLQPTKGPVKDADPILVLAKQVSALAAKSDATLTVVLKAMNDLIVTLSNKDTIVNIQPEKSGLKEWNFTATRVNNNTVNIKGKQIK